MKKILIGATVLVLAALALIAASAERLQMEREVVVKARAKTADRLWQQCATPRLEATEQACRLLGFPYDYPAPYLRSYQ